MVRKVRLPAFPIPGRPLRQRPTVEAKAVDADPDSAGTERGEEASRDQRERELDDKGRNEWSPHRSPGDGEQRRVEEELVWREIGKVDGRSEDVAGNADEQDCPEERSQHWFAA